MKVLIIAIVLAVSGCAQFKNTVTYNNGVISNGDQKAFDECIARINVIKRCLDAAR